jgi:hypothetical protein
LIHRTHIARTAITLALVLAFGSTSASSFVMADPAPVATKSEDFSYPYWDYILRTTVISPGMSDRSSNPVTIKVLNSRFEWGNRNPTAIEGNRIYLGAFEGENLATLVQIREHMESLPVTHPMGSWTPDERLAYWLNLYNVTMVEQLARHYPKRMLKDLLYGDEALLDQKTMTVGGVPLSLNDIHHRIVLAKWDNPLVMYGFYHGYISGPNIRREAFTPETVWTQLEENAVEFVNSNRGAKVKGRKLQVAELYRINAALFPNFEEDVKKHVTTYLKPAYAALAQNTRSVVATTSDYYTTDIEMGITLDHQKGDDMLEDSALASLGRETLSSPVRRGWPSHVGKYMAEVHRKRERELRRNPDAQPNVTIDELPMEPEKSDDKDGQN